MGVILMKYQIVCVGSIKEQYLKDALKEYEKRLSKFGQVSIVEIEEEKLSFGRPSDIERVKGEEGKRILSKVSGYVILCDIQGKLITSEELSCKLEQVKQTSSTITFIIGGSFGVSEDVKKRANERISFSLMTFPHQLMRVILLEQIYRAETIMHHIPYHK